MYPTNISFADNPLELRCQGLLGARGELPWNVLALKGRSLPQGSAPNYLR